MEETKVTDEEKKRMAHLEHVESAAKAVLRAFSNELDYDAWDKALDKLETVLKEKL
jgi:hypothetical protein